MKGNLSIHFSNLIDIEKKNLIDIKKTNLIDIKKTYESRGTKRGQYK